MEQGEKRRTYLLLGLTAMIWGIQPLCIKWLLDSWSPLTIAAVRYWLISAALFLLLRLRKEKIVPPRGCWFPLLVMGLTGIALNNILQFSGLALSTVANCTLIAAASPAITAFFSIICIRERLPLLAWLGILISLLGTVLVVSHGQIDIIRHLSFNRGDILFFLAQLAWTIYSIVGLGVMHHISAVAATAWAGLWGAVVASGYGMVTGEFVAVPLALYQLAAFAYTVVLGGIMAMLFWNIGVKKAGPSITAIFQNITPLVGMLGGSLLFGETLGLAELAGALAIFIGVYLTTHSQLFGWR